MNILEKIIAQKKIEVAERSSVYPEKLLEKSIYFNSPVVSLASYLTRPNSSGVIAEFKRKSPSKGMINAYAQVDKTTVGYMQGGAAALSVLTDRDFFGGKLEDLTEARKFNYCPVLRKDFIISEYQIIEARSAGADAILLIASVLTSEEIRRLASFARSLGLEILFEVHTKEELQKIDGEMIVGINNRNLGNFSISVDHSFKIGAHIPVGYLKVSESGIENAKTMVSLKDAGFNGFLIGGYFMKHSDPAGACAKLISDVNMIIHSQKRNEGIPA